MTIQQGFPSLGTPMLTPEGTLTAPWLNFFSSLWNRTGGATGFGYFALLNGSPDEVFSVAPAVTQNEATPLSQVQLQIRTIAGNEPVVVSMTTSPMNWTAQGNGALSIGGNGVSSVSLTRGGIAVPIAKNYGLFPVRTGDEITINYIGIPALTWIPD